VSSQSTWTASTHRHPVLVILLRAQTVAGRSKQMALAQLGRLRVLLGEIGPRLEGVEGTTQPVDARLSTT